MAENPTPPAVSEALREAVARVLSQTLDVACRIPPDCCPGALEGVVDAVNALCAPSGPIASEIDHLTVGLAELSEAYDNRHVALLEAQDKIARLTGENARIDHNCQEWVRQAAENAEAADRLARRAEAAEAALSRLQADRDAEVGKLRALSDAAAPGEWSVSGVRRRVDEPSCVIIDAPSCPVLLALPTGHGAQALEALRDAKFAVAAVNFVRAALTESTDA